MVDINKIFEERKDNPIYNTSYPLVPEQWARFRTSSGLDFSQEKEMSFYIHIPFCQHLCSFCEYARISIPNEETQKNYLKALENDINTFANRYPAMLLNGFDIGGGTPTSLSEENFRFLICIYQKTINRLKCTTDFEPSIEATFQTISEAKARAIVEMGIGRISLGIQSSADKVQMCNGRINSGVDAMQQKMAMMRKSGIRKINIDLMYGLRAQNRKEQEVDLRVIELLQPEQVTLYELRTNRLLGTYCTDKNYLYNSYQLLYNGLLELGYEADFGQNTFTKHRADQGLSSYLRHRMFDFSAYKGFGISAQSKCRNGLSYNVGKLSGDIKTLLSCSSFTEEYVYSLPVREMLSKYIAVAGYSGRMSITVANGILGADFIRQYQPIIEYCLAKNYIEIEGDFIKITRDGFRFYGAIFSLFYFQD